MRKHVSTITTVLVFLTGLSLLLYPTVSNYWNSKHQTQAVAEYSDRIEKMDEQEKKQAFEQAEKYNETLISDPGRFTPTEEQDEWYKSLLDIDGTGMMGYITIPEIDCKLAVYHTVDDSYFDDAVFIGDSRTVGMYEYGGLEETSTFYASTGLTVYKMFDSAIVSVPGQKKKITVEEALSEKQFAKIYLMIGINEMGTGTVESFMKAYGEAVQHLQELQPDAVIYLQAIMKVTTERSEQGDYITNEGIGARNAEIAELADDQKIFFLDVNPLICDETGGMVASYTYDGVHLKAQYIPIWLDFLKEHAVE